MERSCVILEIKTKMKKNFKKNKELEKSIHLAIPRMLDDSRVKDIIQEILNEGGWINDFDDCNFPDDYCEFTINVLNNYQ